MDFCGQYRIAAPRERFWIKPNDPEVQRASIPDCHGLTWDVDEGLTATVKREEAKYGTLLDYVVQVKNGEKRNHLGSQQVSG